tara:strand:+ start:55 stop:1134 length:1080 start_codon:yes stop_codon:yes gene_type:complete
MNIYNKNWSCQRSLKFRVVKLQLYDNTFRTYFNPSRNRLKRLLIQYQPKNVYVSVSRWQEFSEHPTYPNRFIDADILIDIDNSNDLKQLESINEYLLKKYELVLLYRIRSGTGLNLIYCYKKKLNFEENKELRETITNDLESKGYDIDVPVMKDIYRVSRVDNTLNGNKNLPCHVLGTKPNGLRMTTVGDSCDKRPSPTLEEPSRAENQNNLPTHFSYNFISNSVVGTKGLYVPIIKWDKLYKKRLKKLLKMYNLGSFIHIKTLNNTYLVFLKALEGRRLEKIYKEAKSRNLREFLKYKWNWVMIKSKDFPIKKTYFKLKTKGSVSKPHSEFFNVPIGQGNTCGNGLLKVYKANCELRN